MLEVVEIATQARMSRSPKPGDFKGMNRKGQPEFFAFNDLMGSTLFESAEKAVEWIKIQGLERSHVAASAREE